MRDGVRCPISRSRSSALSNLPASISSSAAANRPFVHGRGQVCGVDHDARQAGPRGTRFRGIPCPGGATGGGNRAGRERSLPGRRKDERRRGAVSGCSSLGEPRQGVIQIENQDLQGPAFLEAGEAGVRILSIRQREIGVPQLSQDRGGRRTRGRVGKTLPEARSWLDSKARSLGSSLDRDFFLSRGRKAGGNGTHPALPEMGDAFLQPSRLRQADPFAEEIPPRPSAGSIAQAPPGAPEPSRSRPSGGSGCGTEEKLRFDSGSALHSRFVRPPPVAVKRLRPFPQRPEGFEPLENTRRGRLPLALGAEQTGGARLCLLCPWNLGGRVRDSRLVGQENSRTNSSSRRALSVVLMMAHDPGDAPGSARATPGSDRASRIG